MALSFVSVRAPPKYTFEYTHALKQQIPAIVLGDDLPLRSNLRGWHAKLELFAPWNKILRPLLFFDLDTYIFNVEPLKQVDRTKFWMINDFGRKEFGESGIMLVPDDDELCERIYTENIQGPDGAYLRNFPHKRLNNAVDGIYSYKHHCKDNLPDDATIVCFHGVPKPHETTGWAKDHWNSLTKNCWTP